VHHDLGLEAHELKKVDEKVAEEACDVAADADGGALSEPWVSLDAGLDVVLDQLADVADEVDWLGWVAVAAWSKLVNDWLLISDFLSLNVLLNGLAVSLLGLLLGGLLEKVWVADVLLPTFFEPYP
jgi:hypothetical protein